MIEEGPRQIESVADLRTQRLNAQCLGRIMAGTNEVESQFFGTQGIVMSSLASHKCVDPRLRRLSNPPSPIARNNSYAARDRRPAVNSVRSGPKATIESFDKVANRDPSLARNADSAPPIPTERLRALEPEHPTEYHVVTDTRVQIQGDVAAV